MSSVSRDRLSPQRRRPAAIFAIVLLALAAGAVGGVIAHALEPSTATPSATASSGSCPIEQVANDDLRSVVTITATSGSGQSTGSGEVIRSGGYIVTNNHVVASAAAGGTITVHPSTGGALAATIVGRDPETDIAVVRATGASSIAPIPVGDSTSLRIGQSVIALGAPLGLSSTVTSGIVSALDRTIAVPGDTNAGALLLDAIQTDAAINPGNSGGALVNCSGKLVGIPSASASIPTSSGEQAGGSIGLGFAIPVDLVIQEVDEIISTGSVRHAYLGLQAEPISANATAVGGRDEGLLLTVVTSGGPAADAGLRVGDVLLAANGTGLSSTDQLVELTLRDKPGTKVTVTYVRAGRQSETTVVLGARPTS
jgi:putative serine protease PepD